MSDREFLFSVIMPIYNTDRYLHEAIDSVIEQSVGFKEHIQLVLVDDGSTDSSGAICDSYAEKHPENIIAVHQENGGVSKAMNTGLKHAAGKYVNFFGSDDMWGKSAFQHFKNFIQAHEGIHIVSCKMILFGSSEGEHALNYKYTKTRVVNLDKEPECVQLTTGNCVIMRSCLNGRQAKEGLQYAEDALLINSILLEDRHYGVIAEGEYWYRRRNNFSLAFTAFEDKTRFIATPRMVFKYLFDLSREMYGEVLPFIQHTVMYESQWRIKEVLPQNMTDDEKAEYDRIMRGLFSEISDKCIREQLYIPIQEKAHVMKMRHGADLFERATWKNGRAYYQHTTLLGLNGRTLCRFQVLEVDGDELTIRGYNFYSTLWSEYVFFARDNEGNTFDPDIVRIPSRDIYAYNGELIARGEEFIFRLPLKDGLVYKFFVRFKSSKGEKTIPIPQPGFAWYGKIDNNVEHGYWTDGKRLILKWEKRSLRVYSYKKKSHIMAELRYLRDIARYNPEGKVTPAERRRAILLRLAYHAPAPLLRGKKVWIVSDRDDYATDNGSAFFKFATTHLEDKSIKPFFLLNKTSRDYPTLKKYGKVVTPHTLKHHILLLRASKVISAYYDTPVFMPFKGQSHFFQDLVGYDFVYLQHGIMQGDLSKWLNVLEKNIKLISATTQMEVDAYLGGDFGYTDREVKLLGSPRFDALSDYETKRVVAFLPTWRIQLAGSLVGKTRTREYVPEFHRSDYCKFYNALINDERLLRVLKEHGFTGVFYTHPAFEQQVDDFYGNDVVYVNRGSADYPQVLGESAILVTDYSGVQFDFAYQRKPLVYSQFDDIYAKGTHTYKNTFFDYREDGFGPVVQTVDEVVDSIVEILENNCQLSSVYRERIDKFFCFSDSNNSQRAFEAVLAMEND